MVAKDWILWLQQYFTETAPSKEHTHIGHGLTPDDARTGTERARTAAPHVPGAAKATLFMSIGEETRRLHHVFEDDLERLHHTRLVPMRAQQDVSRSGREKLTT